MESSLHRFQKKKTPSAIPPTLNKIIRMIAGFLNRKKDGLPGPQTVWIGLQRTKDFALAIDSAPIAGNRVMGNDVAVKLVSIGFIES